MKESFNNCSSTASTKSLKNFLVGGVYNNFKAYQLDMIQAFIQFENKRYIFLILGKVYSIFCTKSRYHYGQPLRQKCLCGADFSGIKLV